MYHAIHAFIEINKDVLFKLTEDGLCGLPGQIVMYNAEEETSIDTGTHICVQYSTVQLFNKSK